MQDGNLVESGKANEVFDNPKEDYTNKLLTAALKYATN
jgi:ABC-type microcin C transport system duplicated ATPase subunit YejF